MSVDATVARVTQLEAMLGLSPAGAPLSTSSASSAASDRHALERLAERRRAEFVLESNRREGAELDELAAAGHRRRSLA